MRALTKTLSVKQVIDIGFVDFAPGSREPTLWSALLGNRFAITSSRHPRYVLHSCLTTLVLSEPGIRIFASGENVRADFNISDYALDFFEHIFSQPLEKAYRRDRVGWGRIYEERMNCAFNHPVKQLVRHAGNTLRKRARNSINTLRRLIRRG